MCASLIRLPKAASSVSAGIPPASVASTGCAATSGTRFTLTKAAYDNTTEEYRKQMLASVRSPRLGAPEDIAAMVAFLFSDVGAYKQNRAPSVGEEAEVANADEALREQMQQEAGQELIDR